MRERELAGRAQVLEAAIRRDRSLCVRVLEENLDVVRVTGHAVLVGLVLVFGLADSGSLLLWRVLHWWRLVRSTLQINVQN